MSLPNLSYMMDVSELRYIQSVYEAAEYRNPDILVRDCLPTLKRWLCDLRGWFQLARFRSEPFYFYVIARTKYYDAVFAEAIAEKMDFIVNIGCGSDTRAYRFSDALTKNNVRVLECDQPEAIHAKQEIARRHWPNNHVDYLAIDLNDETWPEFERWLTRNHGARMLVLMEGVSPYVNEAAFGRFLDLLATRLQPGSRVAYDYKLRGVFDGFGRSDRTQNPFRLTDVASEVAAYHRDHGYRLEHMELSSDLSLRLLPSLTSSGASLFRADGLVRLSLAGK